MLGIFRRKKYLADYLGGFVDMHNHLLPGLDDGAKTVWESITMIKGFSEIGVQKFIATPHIMDNYYPNTARTINDALALLKNELLNQGLNTVSIEAAAEHMIDANFGTLLEHNAIMPLKKDFLLVEMSYLQPSLNFGEAIQEMADKRYFPILAHPERYVFLKKDSSQFKKYKEQGILFQMNLLSLSDFYGKDVQKKAHHLLEEGLIDFVSSDVHNKFQFDQLKNMRLENKQLEMIRPLLERTIQQFS